MRERDVHQKFYERNIAASRIDKIMFNQESFCLGNDNQTISTNVHGMPNLLQTHEGKAGGRHYHSREWARQMLHIDLHQISLDAPDRMTGQHVSHEIVTGGRSEAVPNGRTRE